MQNFCKIVLEGHKASGSLSSHLEILVLSATITSVQPAVASCRPWPLHRQQDPHEPSCPCAALGHAGAGWVLLSARLLNDCRTPSHGIHARSDCPWHLNVSFSLNSLPITSPLCSFCPPTPPVKRLGSEQQTSHPGPAQMLTSGSSILPHLQLPLLERQCVAKTWRSKDYVHIHFVHFHVKPGLVELPPKPFLGAVECAASPKDQFISRGRRQINIHNNCHQKLRQMSSILRLIGTAMFPPGGAQTKVTGLLSLNKEPALAVLLNYLLKQNSE